MMYISLNELIDDLQKRDRSVHLDGLLRIAKSIKEQGGDLHTRLAVNGPTILEAVNKELDK